MSEPGRRWLEVRVRSRTAGERAPLLAEALVTLGGRAVEERDGWYVTHVGEPSDAAAFSGAAQAEVVAQSGLDDVEIEVEWREHEEWAETWKRGLTARRVTERIVVHPSWIEPEGLSTRDVVIVIDPGMAFGTAEHGTTRGCLRLLDRVVRSGDHVLDVGAGSGVLSIAAARLGAERVVAVEGDALACEALAENVELNGVAGSVEIVESWATADSVAAYRPMSGVIANIETGLLEPLYGGLVGALHPGGWLIVSGILEPEWPGVEIALESFDCDRAAVDSDGEWRSGLFTLRV